MVNTEEWDRSFMRALPVVSMGLAVVSVAIGVMGLRSRTMARRMYYQDGSYLVNVRSRWPFTGQWHDLRDFVTPNDPAVQEVYGQYGPASWSLLDFVCRNVSYRRDVGEFWKFPSETLASGEGDCEDSSLLLCSLNGYGYVALGTYQGYGHAWCDFDGQVLETTYTQARHVPDPQNYYPYLYFNQAEVIELWPGAMGEIFGLPRKETTKLDLMAKVLHG